MTGEPPVAAGGVHVSPTAPAPTVICPSAGTPGTALGFAECSFDFGPSPAAFTALTT